MYILYISDQKWNVIDKRYSSKFNFYATQNVNSENNFMVHL